MHTVRGGTGVGGGGALHSAVTHASQSGPLWMYGQQHSAQTLHVPLLHTFFQQRSATHSVQFETQS